jgi:transcriptional regulator with XRE-family HTH domain
MNTMQNIHIGSIIEQKLNERSISIEHFADMINRHRTTVYSIFRRKSIDIELLIKISEALEYDFVHEVYFPENTVRNERQIFIGMAITQDELDKMELPKEFFVLVKNRK